jgi:MFS family permease
MAMRSSWFSLSRNLRLFLTASAVSFLGDGMRYAALPLLAVRRGAGPEELGLLLGFATLPFLVVGVFGGVLADRMSHRTLLISCDVLRSVLTAAFVIIVLSGHVLLPELYAVAFLMGSLESVATSATFAYVPYLAAGAELEQANSMSTTALVAGRMLIGPLAGAVLVEITPSLPFLLDGITFVLSAVLLTRIPSRQADARRVNAAGARSVLADVLVSARWMRATPHILLIACSAAILNLFNMGALAVQPDYAEHVLKGSGIVYGAMMASPAVGGIVGAQGMRLLSTRLATGKLLALSLALVGGGYLIVAGAPQQVVAYLGLFIAGSGFAVWAVATTTWRQRVTPISLRGRADALHRVLSWGVNPIGSLLGGLVAARGGDRLPFLLAGLVPFLILPLFARRRLEHQTLQTSAVTEHPEGSSDSLARQKSDVSQSDAA